MSASDRSVLIGFADALAAPEVAASLLGAGYHVASFVRRGQPVALSRLRAVELIDVTPPERDLPACLDEMAAIAASHDVTIPLSDPAVLVCDRALPANAIVAGPRGAQANLALDKRLQLRGAAAAGLAVPRWSEVAAGDKITGDWGTPTILKPALAVEEVANRIRRLSPRLIASQAELDAAWEVWGESTPVLVQRWIRGVGAGLFGLADTGGIHHLSAHTRVRMMNPSGSGSSACASAPPPPELLGPAERFIGGADWQGLFMIELLRSSDSWWFMELNGRPWGSLALSRRLGFEYPAWAVARALDGHVVLPDPPPFRQMLCRNLGRELVHLAFVLRGPRSEEEQWPGRWSTLGALARPRRETTWYNLESGMRRLFVYDAWRTVVDQTVGRHR